MSLSLLAGATSGLAAAALVLLGILILLPVSIRLLFAVRRPGRARVAKGLAAGALVLVACGLGLFMASDLTDQYPSFRHVLDSATPGLAGFTVLLASAIGIRVGLRAGRRGAAAPEQGAPAETEKPGAEQKPAAAPPASPG